jgi:hypothetical protein
LRYKRASRVEYPIHAFPVREVQLEVTQDSKLRR